MDIDTDIRPLCSDHDHWMTLYMFRQKSPNKIFRIVDIKNMIRYVGTFMGTDISQPPLQNLSKRILKLNLIRTLTNIVCNSHISSILEDDLDKIKVIVRRLKMYGLNFMEPNLIHNFNDLFNVVVGDYIVARNGFKVEIKLKLSNLTIYTTDSGLFKLPDNHNTVNGSIMMDGELDLLSSLTLRLVLDNGLINPNGIVLIRQGYGNDSVDSAYREQPIQKSGENVDGSDMVNCKICFENVANVAIKKCGHIFCGLCMDKLDNKCGLCRTTFRGAVDLLNLYFN